MPDFTAVEQAVQEAIARGAMPGAALAFGQGNAALFCKAFGRASLRPQQAPVEERTLFDLASLTKVLATGLLAMKLWEEGLLDLDAPLAACLPGHFPPDKAGLSLRLLLAHAAGLPAHVPFYRDRPPEPADPRAQRQEIFRSVRQTPLAYPPGTQTRYSDLGFILIGELLELLAGDRLDRLCAARLFAPLGLGDTFFVHLDDPLPGARRPAEIALSIVAQVIQALHAGAET